MLFVLLSGKRPQVIHGVLDAAFCSRLSLRSNGVSGPGNRLTIFAGPAVLRSAAVTPAGPLVFTNKGAMGDSEINEHISRALEALSLDRYIPRRFTAASDHGRGRGQGVRIKGIFREREPDLANIDAPARFDFGRARRR